jgi:hypothetical protein
MFVHSCPQCWSRTAAAAAATAAATAAVCSVFICLRAAVFSRVRKLSKYVTIFTGSKGMSALRSAARSSLHWLSPCLESVLQYFRHLVGVPPASPSPSPARTSIVFFIFASPILSSACIIPSSSLAVSFRYRRHDDALLIVWRRNKATKIHQHNCYKHAGDELMNGSKVYIVRNVAE